MTPMNLQTFTKVAVVALLASLPLLSQVRRTPVPRDAAAATHPSATGAASPRQVVGYFPQWGVYDRRYVVSDLVRSGAVNTLTQIDYAQGNICDNACVIADPQADINLAFKPADSVNGVADAPDAPLRGNFHQLQLLRARYPRLRMVLSLEGKRSLFEDAAKPENRVAFVHSCIARFLEGHVAPGVEMGRVFDGIDVDWEYPDANHADDFYALMAEFRRQMDALHPGLTLSIASGASVKNIDPIDWKRVAASVDQIGVMTYDYQGPWSHTTGFVAPLQSANEHDETVASVIEAYLAAGVPSRKLLLGLPFYAYQWQNVPDNGTHGLGQKGDPVRGNLNQSTATSLLAANASARLYRDPASLAPWVYDGNNFLTFEDPTSVRAKAAFAASRQLGGVMIWELSGDTEDAQLMRALQTGTVTAKPPLRSTTGGSF